MNTRKSITAEIPYLDQDGINKALKLFNAGNSYIKLNLTERTAQGLLNIYKKCHDFATIDELSAVSGGIMELLEYRIFPDLQKEMGEERLSGVSDLMFTMRTVVNLISDIYTEVAWIEQFNEKSKTDAVLT